jgi:hypothetical protein
VASAPWVTDLEGPPAERLPPVANLATDAERDDQSVSSLGDDGGLGCELDTEAAVLSARRAVWDEAEAWVTRAEALTRVLHRDHADNAMRGPNSETSSSDGQEAEDAGEAPGRSLLRGGRGQRASAGSSTAIRLDLPPFFSLAGPGGGFFDALEGDAASVGGGVADEEDALSASGASYESDSAWSSEYPSLDGDNLSQPSIDRPSSAASSPRSLHTSRSTGSRARRPPRSRAGGGGVPGGGFGATLPLSSEKPVLRGPAAEAAALERASLWAANVEGLAAERRARVWRADERRRAAYAKAATAGSSKARELRQREARAATAHASRQRASVSFAVNNNQKVRARGPKR